jgi:prepilin-type N-terminal cleavage/methylation domain-containing protein
MRKAVYRVIQRYREIREGRKSGEYREFGFTLIELLIVIVVLGILAAIVIFSLSGVTGQSAVAACNSDAKTVQIAVAAYNAENGTTAAMNDASLTASTAGVGAPYLHTFPAPNSNYTVTIDGTGNVYVASKGDTNAVLYDDQTSGSGCAGA